MVSAERHMDIGKADILLHLNTHIRDTFLLYRNAPTYIINVKNVNPHKIRLDKSLYWGST